MDTKQIDYILELSETKNFNRAAENLFISQPALTYQIKQAEAEIGFMLFERSPKGAVLTPAGEQFCVTLRNIRDELKRAVEQGQNYGTRYRTNITIGLPMRSAIYFLPEAIETFSRNNEGVSVTPHFLPLCDASSFLKGEEDIFFARHNDVKHIFYFISDTNRGGNFSMKKMCCFACAVMFFAFMAGIAFGARTAAEDSE